MNAHRHESIQHRIGWKPNKVRGRSRSQYSCTARSANAGGRNSSALAVIVTDPITQDLVEAMASKVIALGGLGVIHLTVVVLIDAEVSAG